jgi:hypothetical protein
LDAVLDYDPFGASYAFSPIGFQGITCGGGNTQNCRNSTSAKYRINIDHFRAAALWQFGGYGENNASNGAYQFGVGADIPTWGKDVLSVDAIYSHVRDSVALALAPGSNNAFGMPIPPFLPQTLTATISDNTAAMFVAKYTTGPLKLYAGYEHIRYAAPGDPQTAFTDIARNFLCQGCQAFNNTNINNAAFGVNGLGNRVLEVMWTGAKYGPGCDRRLLPLHPEFLFRYPHWRARLLLRQRALAMRRDVRCDFCCGRLEICAEVGSLFRHDVQPGAWRVGLRLLPPQQHRSHGWIAVPLLKAG